MDLCMFSFQVTSLLRRVLPEVTPSRLASIIGVKSLPPADISDIIHSTEKGDWTKLGILDMFLGCIAKALTVQLKAKGTTITGTAGTTVGKGVTTVTLPMIFNSRLAVCLCISTKINQSHCSDLKCDFRFHWPTHQIKFINNWSMYKRNGIYNKCSIFSF